MLLLSHEIFAFQANTSILHDFIVMILSCSVFIFNFKGLEMIVSDEQCYYSVAAVAEQTLCKLNFVY